MSPVLDPSLFTVVRKTHTSRSFYKLGRLWQEAAKRWGRAEDPDHR